MTQLQQRWKRIVISAASLFFGLFSSAWAQAPNGDAQPSFNSNPEILFSGFFGGDQPDGQHFYIHRKITSEGTSEWDEGGWFKLGDAISAGTLIEYNKTAKRLTIQPREGASFDLVLNGEGRKSSNSVSRAEALMVLEDYQDKRALSEEDASLASKIEVVQFEDFSDADKERFGRTYQMFSETIGDSGSDHYFVFLQYEGEIFPAGGSKMKRDLFSPEVMAALTKSDWLKFQSERELYYAKFGFIRRIKKQRLEKDTKE